MNDSVPRALGHAIEGAAVARGAPLEGAAALYAAYGGRAAPEVGAPLANAIAEGEAKRRAPIPLLEYLAELRADVGLIADIWQRGGETILVERVYDQGKPALRVRPDPRYGGTWPEALPGQEVARVVAELTSLRHDEPPPTESVRLYRQAEEAQLAGQRNVADFIRAKADRARAKELRDDLNRARFRLRK